MRSIIFVLALLLMPVGSYASAQGIASFDKLNWGMSRQQVAAAYPNFEEWSEEDFDIFDGKFHTVQKFGLRHFWIADCDLSMDLDFLDNKLTQLSMTGFVAQNKSCRQDIKDTLLQKYGRDPKIDKRETITYGWDDHSLTLRFVETYLKNRAIRGSW